MNPLAGLPTPADTTVVCAQLGRDPRGAWWVAVRCLHGYPQVIGTPPFVDDEPFPTLYWLTCPYLAELVSAAESEGAAAEWARRLGADQGLAERMRAADARYRAERAAAAPGRDPVAHLGIAGQRDPLGTKCLHAHVASALAGIDDPAGAELLAATGEACDDIRCAALTCLREEIS
mgnify:CR=1 FL=1